MRHLLVILYFIHLINSNASANHLSGNNELITSGYISFSFHVDQDISNGYNDTIINETLFEIQDIGKCELQRDYSSIILYFKWSRNSKHKGFYLFLNQLEARHSHFIQLTWNSLQGKSDMYINGVSLRTENENYYTPWDGIKLEPGNFKINKANKIVSNIEFIPRYLPQNQIIEKVPQEKACQNTKNFYATPPSTDRRIKKGELIYTSNLSNPKETEDWIMEGPGKISFVNNEMTMESNIPNPPDGFTGHFNLWCPKEFPDDIIVEWEFAPISDHGVCHLFFSARGNNNKDIFDAELKVRDGHYAQYHSGDITNYFIIYFSNRNKLRTTNFATTSLHKSNPYAFLSHGKIGIVPGESNFNKLQLIKSSGKISLYVNGKKCFEYTDKGTRYGEIYKHGKIGFRQMAETKAKYKNFKVYKIK